MVDQRIKFRHLQTFVEVARQKSVIRAAEIPFQGRPAYLIPCRFERFDRFTWIDRRKMQDRRLAFLVSQRRYHHAHDVEG